MTGSFALTIMLFLTFSACLDIVHKLLPSVSDFTPDIAITSQDDSNSIPSSISREISGIPGVESVFGMMHSIEYPAEINGHAATVDLFSHGDTLLDSFKRSVISGDISKVYGNSRYVMAVYSDHTSLDVGDTVKIGDEVLEVGCVLSEGVGSISGSPVIVCSDETYTRLTGEQGYAMIGVMLEKDASEAAVNRIYALSDGYVIMDRRAEDDTVQGSYWVFRIAAYGFLAIISLITILNIMNSVSMGVSARMKQYGAMRAVGMESRQVTKMIAAEAMTYAVSGAIVGIFFGLLLHYLIYVRIVITHFGGAWSIPFTALAAVLLLVVFSWRGVDPCPGKAHTQHGDNRDDKRTVTHRGFNVYLIFRYLKFNLLSHNGCMPNEGADFIFNIFGGYRNERTCYEAQLPKDIQAHYRAVYPAGRHRVALQERREREDEQVPLADTRNFLQHLCRHGFLHRARQAGKA